jgi:hypothetical protein
MTYSIDIINLFINNYINGITLLKISGACERLYVEFLNNTADPWRACPGSGAAGWKIIRIFWSLRRTLIRKRCNIRVLCRNIDKINESNVLFK